MLLLTLTLLLGLVSEIAGTRRWMVETTGCRGTAPTEVNTPFWLPEDRTCTILRRSIDPFDLSLQTYRTICCKAYQTSPRLHPLRLEFQCFYSSFKAEYITSEDECSLDALEIDDGCVEVKIWLIDQHSPSPEPVCNVRKFYSLD